MTTGNNKPFFEVLRPGINTTIQDLGRNNLYHLGLTISGAIDQKNFKLSNLVLKNYVTEPVLEFAFQGPLLRLNNGNVAICISGDVEFDIIKNDGKVSGGTCYQTYLLNNGDKIDIKHTKNSLYGYLAVKDGFEVEKIWDSCSINTQANIGPNDGKKFSLNQKIFVKKILEEEIKKKKLDHKNVRSNIIRVIKGTNFNYFSNQAINKFIACPWRYSQ